MEGAPEVIGRYRVLGEIGRGGMSVVYQGFDTQLERQVAIKVLHAHLAGDPQSRQRFQSEARAVARLRHPNIIEVFDFSDSANGMSYLVTEFVKGCTLRQFAEQHGIFFPEVGVLLTQVICRAVAHAHQEGIIHRDLKPENIMVAESGDLKLMDFGIAKVIDQQQQLTLTGTLLGSPAHMAPEALDGGKVDFRSDIFSIGTILYWLSTGKLPFSGSNPHQVIRAIVEGQYPDPLAANPAVGSRLAQVVRKTLERDPEKRFVSVEGLSKELEQLLSESGLSDVDGWLAKLLRHPQSTLEEVKEITVAFQFDLGLRHLKQGRKARALDAFDRVLAIKPSDQRTLKIIEGMRRRQLLRRLAGGFVAVAILLLAATLGWIFIELRTPEKIEPPSLSESHPEFLQKTASPAPIPNLDPEALSPSKSAQSPATAKNKNHTSVKEPKTNRKILETQPVEPKLHPVEIIVEPYFGAITVNGVLVASSQDRETGYGHYYRGNLPEGEHRVTIQHPASVEDAFILKVPSSGQVRRKLQFLPAQLYINCENLQAALFVDGEYRGQAADLAKEPVVVTMEGGPERTVALRLLDNHGRVWQQKLRLRAGEKKNLTVTDAEFSATRGNDN